MPYPRPLELSALDARRVCNGLLTTARPAPGTPSRVLVLLSASRSGSSTIYDLLARCPGVAALAGEIEPYLKLTGNAQCPGGSNAVSNFRRIETLRALVRADLMCWSEPVPLEEDYRQRRLALQWPASQAPREPTDVGWYDGGTPNTPLIILEEPPLVPITQARKPETLDGMTVVIKTPQLVYRPGLIELLFPNSKVEYAHLSRDIHGCVNGLLDGWESPHFWSYRLPSPMGSKMANWWCFDVPPGWQYAPTLLDACVLQWLRANEWALDEGGYKISHTLRYEELWKEGAETKIPKKLGLSPGPKLRQTMTTKKPSPHRWLLSRPWLSTLGQNLPWAQDMQKRLGYGSEKDE